MIIFGWRRNTSNLFYAVKLLLFNVGVLPLKFLCHVVLIMAVLILPPSLLNLFGHCSIAWNGTFPPRLYLIGNGAQIAGLDVGTIIIASRLIPPDSMFHRTVILIYGYSISTGSIGIIINMSSPHEVTQLSVGIGGPIDRGSYVMLHTDEILSTVSDRKVTLNDGRVLYCAHHDTTESIERGYLQQTDNCRRTVDASRKLNSECTKSVADENSWDGSGIECKDKSNSINARLDNQGVNICTGAAVDANGYRLAIDRAEKVPPLLVRGFASWAPRQLEGEVKF